MQKRGKKLPNTECFYTRRTQVIILPNILSALVAYLALHLCSFLCIFLKACDLVRRLTTVNTDDEKKKKKKISTMLTSLIKLTIKALLAR